MQIPSEEYIRLSFMERMQLVADGSPHVGRYLGYAQMTWGAAELVSLLLNRRRRSVNDFIAGTVVIFSGCGLFRGRRSARAPTVK